MTVNVNQFSTHVCLVSHQAAANFLPAVEPDFKPSKVILVVTSEMEKEADRLEQNLKKARGASLCTERVKISSAYNIDEIENELLTKLDGKDEGMILNATGGTKPMMLAALEVFQMFGKPCFYLTQNTNEIYVLSGRLHNRTERPKKLYTNFKLEDYIGCYGYTVNPIAKDPKISAKKRSFFDEVITNPNYQNSVSSLNYYAKAAEDDKSLTYKDQNQFSEGVNALLDKLCDLGVCKALDTRTIKFTDEASRFFVNGGWLEEYTLDQIKKEKDFREAKLGLNIASEQSGATNEIDVAFVYEEHLCIIECKTSKIEKNDWQNFVHKLDFLGDIGGNTTKKFFVSYHPVAKSLKDRAEGQGIKVIDQNLRDLRNTIKRLLTTNK